MLVFKKSSWHYRLNRLIETKATYPHAWATDCRTICSYFWSTLFNIFTTLVFFVVIYVTLTIASLPFIGFFPYLFENSWVLSYAWSFGVLSVIVLFGGVFVIGSTLILIGDLFIKFKDKNINMPTEKLSIVVEYTKAKKQKICPLIEFKD